MARAGRCYDSRVPRTFPSYPACPVCGDPRVNAGALGMRWEWDDRRACVVGRFRPDDHHAGYAGRLHGGILSALFDECLAWACAVARRTFCTTGELAVRFKAPAPLGDTIEITGRTVSSWGPYVRALGEAHSSSGELLATATSTFAALPRHESLRLNAALRFEHGDWDVLNDS
jgi:acyl-coenzyme A thioesterase PaaI-like protein